MMTAKGAMEIKVTAYQVVEKKVAKATDTAGRVYLPKEWIGKRVKICLLDELED